MGRTGDMPSAEQEQVVRFRLHAHNLASRLSRGRLLEAVAACGIRSTPPWIASHSLLARVAVPTAGPSDASVAAPRVETGAEAACAPLVLTKAEEAHGGA